MSVERPTCVVIRCDNGCGDLWGDDEGPFVIHFDTEADALAAAEAEEGFGWRKIGDEWCCPTCPISEKAADILEAAGVEP